MVHRLQVQHGVMYKDRNIALYGIIVIVLSYLQTLTSSTPREYMVTVIFLKRICKTRDLLYQEPSWTAKQNI